MGIAIDNPALTMRGLLIAAGAVLFAGVLAGCGGAPAAPAVSASPPPPVDTRPRTWVMGFSHMPPRLNTESALRGIDIWSKRAEIAVIHEDVPWAEMLGGASAEAAVEQKFGQLVDLHRKKGLKLLFVADITDGLAREKEARALRDLKRSLAEPAVQRLYTAYVLAVVRRLKPDFLGLAAETNMIREIAPPAVYQAVVQSTNAAAKAARHAGYAGPLLISVQVETAWGLLPNGAFRGIERDLKDFPFIDTLGLSSYPYFAYDDPEKIPADYYSRLVAGSPLRVMVTERGWASANTMSLRSSPEMQARYIRRHAAMLESVRAVCYSQLLYADIDLSAWPRDVPDSLKHFVSIGLADAQFRPKPALAAWDAMRARPLQP